MKLPAIGTDKVLERVNEPMDRIRASSEYGTIYHGKGSKVNEHFYQWKRCIKFII